MWIRDLDFVAILKQFDVSRFVLLNLVRMSLFVSLIDTLPSINITTPKITFYDYWARELSNCQWQAQSLNRYKSELLWLLVTVVVFLMIVIDLSLLLTITISIIIVTGSDKFTPINLFPQTLYTFCITLLVIS